ncbi:MAG: cryptochrome/photolyase family protein [Sphingomonadaceae bacterium]
MTSILWFRQDLRLSDQPALAAAAAEGAVVPVYVLDDETPGGWAIGAAQRWWLHHSLASLARDLGERGLELVLRRGKAAEEIARLAAEVGTRRIHAIRHSEPWWTGAEQALARDHDLCLHDGNHLAPLGSVTTGQGGQYHVFSAFWRALCGHMPPAAPVAAPRGIEAPRRWPASEGLEDWGLLPSGPDWAASFHDHWTPGEAAARRRVANFRAKVANYGERRDFPSRDASSHLSPHLHFGEVSARHVWHRMEETGDNILDFKRELAWRDFAAGIVLENGRYGERSLRGNFANFAWRRGDAADRDFAAWTRGWTGYPIVDAGMRQLWATGWMHNRVRMLAASFLTRHLLLHWKRGAEWFWDTLVDADYGNNSVNWQWIAGTGSPAMRFARIMAPLSQSAKFDAGDYIRSWVPELGDVPDEAIHDPEEAGAKPEAYPDKLIGHREARERALDAYRRKG